MRSELVFISAEKPLPALSKLLCKVRKNNDFMPEGGLELSSLQRLRKLRPLLTHETHRRHKTHTLHTLGTHSLNLQKALVQDFDLSCLFVGQSTKFSFPRPL